MTAHAAALRQPTPSGECEFDADLIRRLDRNGPRYTSYPTADRFVGSFDAKAYRDHLCDYFDASVVRPLSLYLHIPFCSTVCFYCGCNKVITRNRARAAEYLRYLEREIAMQSALVACRTRIEQLHLGGGTPTYLSAAQLIQLMQTLRCHFAFEPNFEGETGIVRTLRQPVIFRGVAAEPDHAPPSLGADTRALLADLGYSDAEIGTLLDKRVAVG